MILEVTEVSADRYAELVRFANSEGCVYGQFIVSRWPDSTVKVPFRPSPTSVVEFRDLKGPQDGQVDPSLDFTLVIREVSSLPIQCETDKERPGCDYGYWPSPVPRWIIERILDILGLFPNQESPAT